MINSLKELIENYKNGLLTTINLQIIEEIFENETIQTKNLYKTVIRDSRFKNIKFTNIDFENSAFCNSVLENCVFENINFRDGRFIESTFQNCFFINCDFTDSEFKNITFEKCEFQTNETGSTCFADVNFISSHFDQTLFIDLPFLSIFGAVITNSKFSFCNRPNSKFSFSKRSIEFTGSFFLHDLVDTEKGINELLTKTKVVGLEDFLNKE